MPRLLGAALAACLLSCAPAAAHVGAARVGAQRDTNAPGHAETYKVRAAATQRVDRMNVYIDARSTAGRVDVGLYDNTSRHRLLGGCTVHRPDAGAWNSCRMHSVKVKRGRVYRMALLQPARASGRLAFRYGRHGGRRQLSLYADSSRAGTTSGGTQTRKPKPPKTVAAPTAAFSFSPTAPLAGQAVQFDGGASSCAATPCTYTWEDDGSDGAGGTQWPLGSGATMSFTFQNEGTKHVRLTVLDAQARTATIEHDVTVSAASLDPAPTPTPSPSPTPTPVAPTTGGDQFPGPSTTGVPAGWQPTTTRSSDLTVRTAGAVIENYRFSNGAKLHIEAPNVIVRNSEFQGGQVDTDQPGVVIQNVTLDRLAPESTGQEGAISYCGYTADHVAILGRSEGFRDGCGADTHITNSYVRIDPPATCGDWHGDGIQGYTGDASVHNVLYVENTTIDFNERMPNGSFCGGTAPFFFVGGSGGSPDGEVHVNGLLVKGGGYSFRMGVPGSVQGLKIVDNAWSFGPIDITDSGCGPISPWDAQTVTADADWHITGTVATVRCS